MSQIVSNIVFMRFARCESSAERRNNVNWGEATFRFDTINAGLERLEHTPDYSVILYLPLLVDMVACKSPLLLLDQRIFGSHLTIFPLTLP
jgi:hypothetical protein